MPRTNGRATNLIPVLQVRMDGNGEQTLVPTIVNAEFIRCFYPRREVSGEGTRLTFADGHGFAVTNSFEEICRALGVEPPVLPPAPPQPEHVSGEA